MLPDTTATTHSTGVLAWSLASASLSLCVFFFSSRRRHTRFDCDWSSDVCSSDLDHAAGYMWIDVMNTTVLAAGTAPNVTGRVVALVSVSVFDAVNGIEPRFRPLQDRKSVV